MNRYFFTPLLLSALAVAACSEVEDLPSLNQGPAPSTRKLDFDVSVSRDGKMLTSAQTKGELVDAADLYATMDKRIPFGLVGVDLESDKLVVDNASVYNNGKGYSGYFEHFLWDMPSLITSIILMSRTFLTGKAMIPIPFPSERRRRMPVRWCRRRSSTPSIR